jgi:hypothetical protein
MQVAVDVFKETLDKMEITYLDANPEASEVVVQR